MRAVKGHSQIGLLFWVGCMHEGEIFLAPPPVVLEDDEFQEEPMYATQTRLCRVQQVEIGPLRWDVGTSHCNPYCVDSWPFEPNVLAAKAQPRRVFQKNLLASQPLHLASVFSYYLPSSIL